MSRVDNIINNVNKNGIQKKKSRVDSIIDSVSNGNIDTGVDEEYVNSFLKEIDEYFKSYNNDYKNVGYKNASSLYETHTSKVNELDAKANAIDVYLKANKDKLDKDTYDSLTSTIYEIGSNLNSIFHNSRKTSEYYSQWDTEEDYNKAVKAQEDYEAMSTFDLEAGQKEIDGLTNGEEITALRTRQAGIKKQMSELGNQTKGKGFSKKKQLQKELNEVNAQIKEIESQISSKKSYLDQAKRLQEGLKLHNDAVNAEDFNTSSQYVSTKSDKWYANLTSQYGMGYDDLAYEYINNIDGIRDEINSEYATWHRGDSTSTYEERNLDYMTEDEVKIYNYYYSTEGKEKAEEFLDSIQETLNYRKAAEKFDDLEGRTLNELLFGMEAGLDQFSSGMKNLFNTEDDYIAPSATQIASGMVREDLADDGFKILGNSLGQGAYDLTTTTFNMLPSILTSTAIGFINPVAGQVVGAGLMGASASGNAYAEMLNLGYDKGQARLYSGMVGASEATLQYLLGGIGKLGGGKLTTEAIVKIANNMDNAFARVAIKLGANAVGEFTEEYLQEVLNPFFKNLTLGTSEDVKLFSTEALYSGILGALSAGILEGGSTIAGDVKTTNLGKKVQKIDGGVARLKKLGTTFSADTVAHQIADKVTEETGAYKIGLLLQEVGGTLSEQNVSDIVIALTKKGMDESSAKKIAKSYQAFLNGEMSLTDEQVAVLEGLNPLADVLRKNIIGRNTDVYQRTREYSDLVKLATEMETQAKSQTTPQAETTPQPTALYSNEYIDSVAKEFEAMGMPTEQARIMAQAKLSAPTEGKSSPTEEKAVESKFEVSADGKTINTKNDEIVTIKNIESVSDDGEANLTLNDGMVVKASNLSFGSDAEAIFVENIGAIKVGKKPISTNSANALYMTAMSELEKNPNMTADEADSLIRGLKESYFYGTYNLGRSKLTARDENGKAVLFAGELTQAQRKFAYELGTKDAVSKVEADQKVIDDLKAKADPNSKKKHLGKIIFEKGAEVDESTLTATQKANLDGIKLLAQISSVEFHVFRSNKENGFKYTMADGIVVSANGWFVGGTNQIWVDLNAGNFGEGTMIRTAAHEISHYIKQWSPQKWRAMADLLMEEFAKNGVNTESMINKQIAKIKRRYKANKKTIPSEPVLLDMAYEELACDALQDMLTDGSIVNFIAEVKAKDMSLAKKIINAIKSLLKKWGLIIDDYKGRDLDTAEAQALSQLEDTFKKLQEMYREAFMDANETVALLDNAKPISSDEIITDGATVTDSNGNVYSIRSMKSDIAEGQMFEDLKTYCGFTQRQVNTLKKQLEDLVEYMTPFRDIVDLNETYGREGRRFAPYKPNSDPLYTISLDFSTQCSKRLLTQYVIEQLQLREKRPMSAEEQMAIRDMLKEYGKIEKGLQVACVMCYVEAARLKSPKQIQKWLDDPATVMRNYFADKNPEFSAYIKKAQEDFKESRGYARNASKKEMKEANKKNGSKDVTALNKIRPKLRAEYKPSTEEMAIIETAVALPKETFLTAGNLANLSEEHSEIYKAFTAFIRTATRSKALETDEPYYYGDSTRDNGNGIIVSDSFIEAVNRENGMRFSSWSDWRIQHLLDWITAVIDNSVRGAAMHGYTKYGDEVRVLGNTGMMFNMSGVPGTQTGLNEDGSLNFSETESMDYNEAIALRKEFPETAGLQCIGVSVDHIFALLRSDIIDYVIPYHTSGLNATLRRMGDIYGWKDFTYAQHATENKSIKKEDAIDPEHWHQEPVFSEFFVGYNTGLGGVEAMQKSAENYIRMCKERGLTPKFIEFSKEPNYWKLLIDRKMVNQKTNTLIEQKAVTPKFKFDVIKDIVDQYVNNYDSGLEERAFNHIVENWDNIPQRIRDLKKQGTTKAKSTKKAIDKLANEPLAVQPKGEIKPSERDLIVNADNVQTANEQIASDFTTHIKGIIKDKGGWYAKDIFKYVEEHPELNFVERIYQKDKTVKKDLEKFLNEVNDVKSLESLSWFMGEAYGDKDRTWSWDEGAKYPYRGAVRTFRNAVKKRINEIESEKVGGTNLGVKNGEISLEDTKKLFYELNTNKEIGELAERVFNTAEMLGVNIRFANQTFAKGNVAGDAMGDMVEYKTSYFNDTAYSNQHKAKTILHELIHTCTVYVMHEDSKYNLMVNYHSINGKSDNYVKLRNASTRLNRIFAEIKNDPDFKGQYGLKNSQEMVAELANEEFVALLKKKTLWDRIIDAIAELFGFSRGNSAYDNVVQCLDYILDNPDIKEYKAYAMEQRKNARYDGRGVFGSTNYTDYYENENVMYSGRNTVEQKISSAKTSIPQIPALFKHKDVVFGKTNIDIGGGRFDLATNFLAEQGTKNYVFDPYNRSEEVNRETLAFLQKGNKADTATCANVLNVIAEEGARANVILEVAKAIKPSGTAYFMVYEGDSSGIGRETSAGYQNNRKTADYVGEISQYFESVTRKGKLIIAKNPIENLPKAMWEVTPGKGILYSERVLMGSLFSGGGTLEAGLVYQMLDKEFAVEYNKKIAATYTDNHGKEHMFVGDVRDFNSKDKQNVFYLHASPVCKNFSSASNRGGETTLDITTAQATARVLEEQMPQVFTVENVKRYIGSEAYNIITSKLDELGYTWDVDVYKASDYGNATKRERMIIRAVKDGQLPAKPQKVSSITSWGEATRDLWKTDLIPSNLVRSKIEAIKNTPGLKGVKLTKLDKPLLIYDTTKAKQVSYAWADELAPTLTTKCGDARIIMPDGRVYAPTPKFMGRIQGLPDNYKYPKEKTRGFTIIGNGIPTQLTKAVMGGLLDSAYEQTHDGEVLYSDRDMSSMSASDLFYDIARVELDIEKIERDIRYNPYGENKTLESKLLNAKEEYVKYGEFILDNHEKFSLKELHHLGHALHITNGFDMPKTFTLEQFIKDLTAKVDEYKKDLEIRAKEESKFTAKEELEYFRGLSKADKKLYAFLRLMGKQQSEDTTEEEPSPITSSNEDWLLNEADLPFSERDTSTSNRAILANALESVAQNDIEKNKLAEYKKKISQIETEEQRLSAIQKQLFTKGGVEPEKRKDLQFEAKQIANRINTYDRQLLNLESTTALKNVLNREKALAMKRQKQKDTEYLKQYKEKVAKDKKLLLERNQESRKKAIESREKTAMRHKIKTVVNDLNNLLLKPTKERHVPEEMRLAVAESLAFVNMDTVDADTRVAKYNELIAKANDPDVIASLTETRDRILTQGNKLADKLAKLKDAYGMVRDSADDSLRSMYDDVIYSKIESVQKKVGTTPIRNMSLEQLESVYELYKMVLTTVRDSNKAFAENLKMTRDALGSNTFGEIKDSNVTREYIKHQSLEQFGWKYLKPMQAMKTIGSGTLQKLWNNILYGQEVFAVDYDEAVKFAKEMKDKYGYKKWDLNKQYSFVSKSGKNMKINLEQMMSIYAYSKRNQADEHIEYGGILLNDSIIKKKGKNKFGIPVVVEVKVNDSTAYRLDKKQVGVIISTLEKVAPGAKDFVDEMQKYLSETMGEKGNEVSMKMYGIKLFKEEHYFPLKSSKDFMEAANAKLKGDVKIKNKGMTKSTVEHARNPIVLENFLDVWGNHINEMAMYHGLVLPLEDFSRTLNYSFKADDKANTDAESVRTALREVFGENADTYLNNLLKAINGGVLHDSSAAIADKMISKFKKAKVMASLSVVVQQPTAIIRSMGIIEPKYFVAQNFNHKATWDELKKYCPTAIIKETGSFDTNMGRTIVDMIKEDYTFTDKVGDVLGKAPAFMDEVGWNMIWRALKKKVATEQKLTGEALLQECGKQMTLIINETQVYDSVMSRNELMRSKDGLVKMATSFMAEPTTVANMIYGAALDIKRGNKKIAGKTIAATIGSVVINGLVSSMVYALRDDDEEKTLLEKYLSSATTEVLDGLNPLTYIPFVKDAYSIAQGYKVERADMSLIQDVLDAINGFYNVLDPEAYEGMSRGEIAKHIYENSVPLLTSISDMFGLPVGNILRDAEALIIWNDIPMSQTTGAGTVDALKDGVLGTMPKIVQKIIGNESKQDKLYDAIVSGDATQINRLKGGYKDDKAYETAVRQALREKYIDGEASKETATRILSEFLGEAEDDIYWILDEWDYAIENGSTDDYAKYGDFYTAVETGKSLKQTIKMYTDNGVDKETLSSQISKHFKPMYSNMSASEKTKIKGYLLNAFEQCGVEREKASKKLQYWEFLGESPDSDLSQYQVADYYEYVKPVGISVDTYEEYCGKVKGIEGEGTKQRKMAVIHSMPLTSRQKDALYYAEGWAASKLYEAPWH